MPHGVVEFGNLHILVVDDDAAMLGMIEALLKVVGVGKVSRASSGAEAYNKIATAEKVIDCILCDYRMSNGNGLQLLQAIRMGQVKHCRPDACFVLLTASGAAEIVSAAAQLDVSGYVVKPATPDKLKDAIAKARGRAIKIDRERYAGVVVAP